MKLSTTLAMSALALVTLSACGHEFHPPEEEERIAAAELIYAPALFDSVTWESDSIRAMDGNLVYAESCTRCHGPMGRGETDYARQRELEVPSLVEPEWALANLDTLRHIIFVGHTGGMPIFGASGATPRQIDASAFYVLEVLRPDAMAEAAGG